ncbi:nucleotidyltransferase domain-containing protein, partial [Micromonospora sp. NPDC051296]|uniref:nucleotidyltransferase domain-containing protein n=1 Tax=Micromonospora sp. NPDC051296 TaxID=3155046 RepID=UPI00343B6CE2
MVTGERYREVRSVVDAVAGWAAGSADVLGVLVVGSWARGAARMDSDVDIIVDSVKRDQSPVLPGDGATDYERYMRTGALLGLQ